MSQKKFRNKDLARKKKIRRWGFTSSIKRCVKKWKKVPKSVMHVQGCCFFTYKTVSFLTFWLSASSLWLLKFLIDWNPSRNPPLKLSPQRSPWKDSAKGTSGREKKNPLYALIIDVTEAFHKLSRDWMFASEEWMFASKEERAWELVWWNLLHLLVSLFFLRFAAHVS